MDRTEMLSVEQPRGQAVAAAARPVLIVNPRSGDGKAERVGLVRECQARGIEPAVLAPGDDVVQMAEAAVAGGADVLGMAGGDGSQALVAGVAARHGVPMVVVPAGTRNHLAMDLGLDRGSVVGALDAFDAARDVPVDLGDVNGRPFINNVSLGLYAQIVRSPEYREAKIETTVSMLPQLIGPGTRPSDLRFHGPAGEPHTRAHVVQVSNNAYGRTARTLISRPRLDTGRLGVIAVELRDGGPDRAFLSALAAGHPERYPGFLAWEPVNFEVEAEDVVDVGIDGEAVRMSPPLRFATRPGALRIRIPVTGPSRAARRLRRSRTS